MPKDLFDTQPESAATTGPRDLFEEASSIAPSTPTGADAGANPLASAVSGLSNAGANVLLEAPIKAVAWLGEKLGAINPAIAQRMKEEVSADAEKWFKSSDKTPAGDVFNESRMKYPATSAIPQAALEVGLLSKAMPPVIEAGGSVKSALANTAVQSAASVPLAAGLAGNNTKDQDRAAKISAAIPPVLNILGSGIKSAAGALASKFGSKEELKGIVTPINEELAANNQLTTSDKAAASINNYVTKAKEIENQNYKKIKEIPGTIKVAPIQQKTRQIMADNPRMNTDQLAIFEKISKDAGKIRTMDDAIRFKQDLGDYYSKFKGTSTYKEFEKLKGQVDASIGMKADDHGLTGAWRSALKYHREVIDPLNKNGSIKIAKAFEDKTRDPSAYANSIKTIMSKAQSSPQQMKAMLANMDNAGSKIMEQDLMKKALDDIINSPKGFDGNRAIRMLNSNINKFKDVMSSDSISVLKGAKILLEKSGATLQKEGLVGATNSSYFQHSLGAGVGGMVGAGVGGALGGPVGGAAGGMLGGIVGIGVTPKIIHVVSDLLGSTQGLAVLKSVGMGRPWTNHLGNILKAAGVDLTGKGDQ